MKPELIEVVLLTPPRAHPLAAALRTVIERVARRPGVVLGETTLDALRPSSTTRFVVGLEVGGAIEATMVLGIEAAAQDGNVPLWLVPAEAFGVAIDGLERVQRLGSLLGACLDLAASPDGREVMRTDPAFAPGTTSALAGTAHLSHEALLEAQARALAARAAPMLVGALEEGRAWAIDDWVLPPELELTEVLALLASGEPIDLLKQRALGAAEALLGEVMGAVDQALTTHGLGALVPLQEAIGKLIGSTTFSATADASMPAPSDRVVREADARLAALPKSWPGQALLAFGWAAPAGAVAGVALAPALDVSGPVGSAYALAAAGGSGLFLAGVGLSRAWSAIRKTWLGAGRDRAQRDFDAARADAEHSRRKTLAPEIVRGPLTWFRDELAQERRRLTAIEAAARTLGRTLSRAPAGSSEAPEPARYGDAREVDAAVDLTPARQLTNVVPERIVQRVRSELAGEWRVALPTLNDVLRAAREAVGGADCQAAWVARSDIAQALKAPLATALATVDEGLARVVPRGRQVRRLALMPRPFTAPDARVACDQALPSAGDAHLLVLWRTA